MANNQWWNRRFKSETNCLEDWNKQFGYINNNYEHLKIVSHFHIFILGSDTNAAIADGVTTIVNTLRQQLPNTKILLLGILPRTGAGNFDRICAINTIISALNDGQNVHYLNMFYQFTSDVWGGTRTKMMNRLSWVMRYLFLFSLQLYHRLYFPMDYI